MRIARLDRSDGPEQEEGGVRQSLAAAHQQQRCCAGCDSTPSQRHVGRTHPAPPPDKQTPAAPGHTSGPQPTAGLVLLTPCAWPDSGRPQTNGGNLSSVQTYVCGWPVDC